MRQAVHDASLRAHVARPLGGGAAGRRTRRKYRPGRFPPPQRLQTNKFKAKGEDAAMPKNAIPKLVPLKYGEPYCEDCRCMIRPGELVAWWWVRDGAGRTRRTAVCARSHRDRVDLML